MAYIGVQPNLGQFVKLQSIASSFNGSTTTFQLQVPPGGAAYYVTPGSVNQLIISLGGVIQEPGTDFSLSGSQITFTTAPAASLSFFGIVCGQSIDAATPSDGTVVPSKISTGGPSWTSSGLLTTAGSFSRGAPVTKTVSFTVAQTENWIICNGSGTITVTLPTASSWTGREIIIKTIAAQLVISASSNVVPITGGAAGASILAATSGKVAFLVSDGSNWITMVAN